MHVHGIEAEVRQKLIKQKRQQNDQRNLADDVKIAKG